MSDIMHDRKNYILYVDPCSYVSISTCMDIHICITGKNGKKYIYISLIKREIKYVRTEVQCFKLLFIKVKSTPCVFKHICTCMRSSRHTYFDCVLSFFQYICLCIYVFACVLTHHDILNKKMNHLYGSTVLCLPCRKFVIQL